MENQITLRAEVAAHNQECRRQGLKSKIHALTSQHEANIAEKVGSLFGSPLNASLSPRPIAQHGGQRQLYLSGGWPSGCLTFVGMFQGFRLYSLWMQCLRINTWSGLNNSIWVVSTYSKDVEYPFVLIPGICGHQTRRARYLV